MEETTNCPVCGRLVKADEMQISDRGNPICNACADKETDASEWQTRTTDNEKTERH